MNISFIGLGKLGLPCAEVFAKKGHYVKGYDCLEMKSANLNIVNSIKDAVHNVEIVFIAVPTPHDDHYDGRYPTSQLPSKDFDYSIVKEVIQSTNEYMNSNQVLVLISTVLPGTIRDQLSQYVTNTKLVYNPYFIAMGSLEYDMVNPDLIILGTETGETSNGTDKLIALYNSIVENDSPMVVSNWTECECIKIFYNTFISTKLSFVNTIQDIAEKLGSIDVDNVTNALCKSNDRIISSRYMKAGMGDGGACHPRDNIALKYLSQKLDLGYDFFGSIVNIREMQAKNVAFKLVELSQNKNMPIVVYGRSYKKDVPYLDGSYSILIGNYCAEFGVEVSYIDLFSNSNIIETPSIILLSHQFNTDDELTVSIPDGSIVLDIWRKFSSNKNIKILYYGKSN
jgi:UDPglucose 6-dehydrogenase